ncbi:MAG: twin-arginine translocase subunit TatB [Lysobacteraceae bacterium]|nr:MAG: twin-arginine translocase subunit TatB [Xanthomonadaceae bacterium]
MFDFSFGEMLVVALVALVVLGPERLPKAARFTGLWVRRARAHWYSVKSELESELASEELKRSLHDGRQAMQETERQLHDFAAETRHGIEADAAGDGAPPREPRDE